MKIIVKQRKKKPLQNRLSDTFIIPSEEKKRSERKKTLHISVKHPNGLEFGNIVDSWLFGPALIRIIRLFELRSRSLLICLPNFFIPFQR